jgi:hypothetical protein
MSLSATPADSPDADNLPASIRAKWLKMQTMGSLSSSTNSNYKFETDGLPMFARANWATFFLPTLYTCLGSTSNPWKLYENGSSMVDTIQGILNMVYPNLGYHVKLDRFLQWYVTLYRPHNYLLTNTPLG